MKVVILCGGKGTRMKEKTEFIPKPLVLIGGRPILWHIMKTYAHHGYNDFIIALGYKGEMISNYFAKNSGDGFNITFVNTGEESSTGERVLRVKEYITEDEFMVTYGDGVADIDIQKLLAFHRVQDTIGTLTGVNPQSRFGLINVDPETNHITGFLQKPVMYDRINGGFMVFKREAFDYFDSGSLENIFTVLVPKRQLSVYSHNGFWKCMDTYQEVEELNELWQGSKPWALWERQPADTLKDFFNGKRVLITGHTGFKGSWLTQMLLNWGTNVSGLALPPETNPNLFTLLGLEGVPAYYADIRDLDNVRAAIRSFNPEIVFHLAAQAVVRKSYDDPSLTFTTNVGGTANILEAVKETGLVRAVVIITSDKVYAVRTDGRAYREDDALGGSDPYSASKAAADILAQSYTKSFFHPEKFGRTHQTLIGIARAGNVIGGGDWAPDRLLPDIVRAVYENDMLITIRNPQAVRPWQHVLEPLYGYLMLAKRLYEGDTRMADAWNFGPAKEDHLPVAAMLEKSLALLGNGRYEIVSDNSKPETHVLALDASKAEKFIGWRPRYNANETLRHTLEWYQNYYTNPDSVGDFTRAQIQEFLP